MILFSAVLSLYLVCSQGTADSSMNGHLLYNNYNNFCNFVGWQAIISWMMNNMFGKIFKVALFVCNIRSY